MIQFHLKIMSWPSSNKRKPASQRERHQNKDRETEVGRRRETANLRVTLLVLYQITLLLIV